MIGSVKARTFKDDLGWGDDLLKRLLAALWAGL